MGLPVLEESCFGCCSIKAGARIVSWLSVIFSGLAFVFLFLVEFAYIDIGIGNTDLCEGDVNCTNHIDRNMAQTNSKVLFDIVAIIFGIIILMQGLIFIFGIVNLYGVYKERPNYMVPYLIVSAISILLQVLLLLGSLVVDGIREVTFSTIFSIALGIYFFLIVHSYFKLLKSGGNNGMVI